jgi:hypothetical protein
LSTKINQSEFFIINNLQNLKGFGILIKDFNKNKFFGGNFMQYSHEVMNMVCVAKGPKHGPAPIPEEGKWVQSKEIKDISGLTHGIGWCAPQQGACKLTLNVKNGIIEEALV